MLESLSEWGYLGLFLGSLLSATVIPFSADFLFLGLLAMGGNLFWSVASASAGSGLGSVITYWMGRAGKWEWMQRWFKVTPEKLARQKARIDRYGSWLAFMAWVPFVGGIIPLALGFYKVNTWQSSLFLFLGKTARFIAWAIFLKWIEPLFA